jgi:hypothetical protein
MAPTAKAPSQKALTVMPHELTFFMETPDITSIVHACKYVVAHPTNYKLLSIKGRLELADGTVIEPVIRLDSLHVDLCRKIGNTRFALKKSSKKIILETIHSIFHRSQNLVGDSDDEAVLLSVVCGRRDILVNRFIGVCFSETFVGRIKQSTQDKGRSDYEVGDGAKGERLYREMMDIVNNDSATEHNCFLLPEGDARVIAVFTDRFNGYLESAGAEDASNPTSEKIKAWQELPQLFKDLKKVYDVMHENYFKSGSNEPDAMEFTALALKKTGMTTTISKLNAYYFFVLGWCAGDVMKAFTAFLDIRFVGEKARDSPKKTPDSKKQRIDEMKTLIASNDLAAGLVDDRMKQNSLMKGLENNANRLLKEVQGEKDRKSKLLTELSKLSRVKPKYQNDLHQHTVATLQKQISEYDASITTIEATKQCAKDELNVAYQGIAESSDKPAAIDVFATPASRRSSIASTSSALDESSTFVPLAALGSVETAGPNTPDTDDDVDDKCDSDEAVVDGSNDDVSVDLLA